MSLIRVHDKNFEPYLTEAEVQDAVKRLAGEINRDYADKKPLFIAVLNGAFMFASDLFKGLNIEAEICFIKLASYKGTKSTGKVLTAIGLDAEIYQRHIIIVEDIVDTGKTLSQFLPQLTHQQPASIKICALLHKPEATVNPLTIDYLGFTIPNKFVVGYGLDYDGLGRNIPEIYKLAE
ncbi:MAG TPA: hypoxanthine phosphoribosyltransferase [Chitinophagaceae bacterium]|nr:hypoxanthine phosphoribosyltransferase [Chitinophagaceae bacterium]